MQSEILYNRLMNNDFILDQNDELISENVTVNLSEDGCLELQSKNNQTLIYTLTEKDISNYQSISEKEIVINYDEVEQLFIEFI
tara:strand:- start:2314 stop:2565 length:252 start_codon:yes stop_codon:yes gene_type:complete